MKTTTSTIFITFLCFVCISINSFAQTDTLYTKRKIFTTYTYQNGELLNNKKLKELYSTDTVALRKQAISRIMLPMGPPIAVGGFILAYDGLKGVPRQTIINGKTVDYVERSLSKLLIGLAAFVTGVSFVEGANELKANAAIHFNKKQKSTATTQIQLKTGVLTATSVGFRLDF